MIAEKNKARRITKEIISYFLDNHLNQFNLSFQIDKDLFFLKISAATEGKPASFDKLLADLQTEREIEVDEYFNALLGANSHDHDYSFLGKTIDRAKGGFDDGKLWLEIKRFNLNN